MSGSPECARVLAEERTILGVVGEVTTRDVQRLFGVIVRAVGAGAWLLHLVGIDHDLMVFQDGFVFAFSGAALLSRRQSLLEGDVLAV
jgi:hypothetical protein